MIPEDLQYMQRALQLARKGLYTTHPNPRVGCVLVRGGEVVSEGWHERAGESHAEVMAVDRAGSGARGATAYVTLEPCAHHGRTPPCADALIGAGVSRVVAATEDPYPSVAGQGLARLRQKGIEVACGLLENQARVLNQGFFSRLQRGRPWLRVKLAASLDGATALESGDSKWITGEDARRDVQHWRGQASAIMTGVGTVLADDPRLSVRLPGVQRTNRCVVLDSRWRLPPRARLLSQVDEVFWVGMQSHPVPAWANDKADRRAVITPLPAPAGAGGIDLHWLMAELARREINEIQVEAGETLAGHLLIQGLVDELLLYMAPLVLGASSRGLFGIPALESMDQRINLQWVEQRRVGSDLRLRLRPVADQTDSG
ncbi:MAG: bifunctional diaminohydroxyphosphoribosylaminopyrimidine deaminase/5-amino-6-(5-phosphoribosylamino)uracil reductase RibD [Xanthomonadales bacterium]|nr:bifunctional diaminohydroxyphosphoribosylaminopyrimidine deaminase/5-amino-6-(5-phosphoribosylamino)uracil reductase RibD [Xanthomonadales bacterium]